MGRCSALIAFTTLMISRRAGGLAALSRRLPLAQVREAYILHGRDDLRALQGRLGLAMATERRWVSGMPPGPPAVIPSRTQRGQWLRTAPLRAMCYPSLAE